jgi:preprotein translocase subunit SecB
MGIVIRNIVLEKLNYVKTPKAPDNTTYSYQIRIGNNLNEEDHTAQVMVELEMNEKDGNLKIECCMVGLFELPEDMPLSVDDFLHVNAPAAIFPYMREIVSNLMARSGLKPAFIPMFNFKEMHEKKSQHKE